MKTSALEFPQRIYLTEAYDGDTKYYVAHTSIDETADLDSPTSVGVYEHAATATVTVKVETKVVKSMRARKAK